MFLPNKINFDNKYKYLTLILDESGNLVFCASEHKDQLYNSQNGLILSSLISSKQLATKQASENAEKIMDRLFEEEQSLITQEKSLSQPVSSTSEQASSSPGPQPQTLDPSSQTTSQPAPTTSTDQLKYDRDELSRDAVYRSCIKANNCDSRRFQKGRCKKKCQMESINEVPL